jgi:hypothetical protein
MLEHPFLKPGSEISPEEVAFLNGMLREILDGPQAKVTVVQNGQVSGGLPPAPVDFDPESMIPDRRKPSPNTAVASGTEETLVSPFYASLSGETPAGRRISRWRPESTDDTEQTGDPEAADDSQSPFSLTAPAAQPEKVVSPEQAIQPEHKQRKWGLRRVAAVAGAAVAVATIAVLGVLHITGNQEQPTADQAGAPTELDTTVVSAPTTETEPTTTLTTAPTTTTLRPAVTMPSGVTTEPASVLTTPVGTPEVSSRPAVAEVPPVKTVTFTVHEGDKVFNLVQENLAGRSDRIADNDPLLSQATNRVLEKIAKQNNIPTWKLNHVNPGDTFTVDYSPFEQFTEAAFHAKYLSIITGGK